MTTRSTIFAAISVCLFALAAGADDWPGWRGPQRTGISKETGLLRAWPKNGPKLLWQVTDVGDGYSTPAVVGNRLYVLSNKGTDDEFLQARSVKDGTQVWSIRLGKVGPNQMANYPAARSTPSVDGELLYALGSDGDLVCAKTADGAIVWRKSLRTDFGGVPGLWAYSESPLVDGDLLVCTPGGADATLVALDKKNGTLVWKSAIPGGDEAAYASIISVDVGGLKQYVQFLQNGLVGVEAKTGKFLWRYNKSAAGSLANIPTPIARDGYVFSTTGKGGAGLVKLKVDKGTATAEEVYFKKGLPSSIGGAILRGNSLFGTNTEGLLCIDFATGNQLWQDRSIGPASICYADGRLYLHGENGDLALVEPTAEAYREHGRFAPSGQPKRGKSKAWAYPVVANGRLYIRDLGVIWCYDVADSKQPDRSKANDASPAKQERMAKMRADLKSTQVAVRRAAIGALVHSDISESLREEMQAALADSDADVRATAATAIGNLGAAAVPAVPALIGQLQDDASKEARETAARALGRIGKAAPKERQAVPALRQTAAKDTDPVTRVVALGALAMMEVDIADQVAALRKYLPHDSSLVRMKAAHALGMIGPAAKAAAPDIVTVLELSTDPHERGYIARALGNAGDPASLPALMKAIEKETDAGARGEMRGAISRLGGKAPVK